MNIPARYGFPGIESWKTVAGWIVHSAAHFEALERRGLDLALFE